MMDGWNYDVVAGHNFVSLRVHAQVVVHGNRGEAQVWLKIQERWTVVLWWVVKAEELSLYE
jgi:hypothetical protein